MKIIFLSLFVLMFTNLFCQITVVNRYNLPIALVELSSNKYTILAKSNHRGAVEWDELKNLKTDDTIYFNHVSYNSHWVIKHNIKRNDTIVLAEKNVNLSEIIVTANKKSKAYQTINACYRSYQTNNDSLIYYTDGLVEYMTKIKKTKYQRRLKEYRSYQDSAFLADIKERKMSFSFNTARTPPPLSDYLPLYYFKHKKLILSKNTNGSFDILTKDDIKIGTVKKDSNLVTYYINDIFKCKKENLPSSRRFN